VGEPENDIYKSQKKHRTEVASDALNALLNAAGFDAGDLQIALEAIKAAKEHSKKEDEGEYKFYLEKNTYIRR
jgi:uncharacterized protein Smg (DUF494 family)